MNLDNLRTVTLGLLFSVLGLLSCGGGGGTTTDAGMLPTDGTANPVCMPVDCNDDVECTEDRCMLPQVVCGHQPLNSRCPQGQICNPTQGCISPPPCGKDEDCPDFDPQPGGGRGACMQEFCNLASAACDWHPLDNDYDGHAPQICAAIGGDDCNDANPSINPSASEACDNQDNDCDGMVDMLTESCTSNIGSCPSGTHTCTAGNWSSCIGAGPTECDCCDGIDNDGDGILDGIDADCAESGDYWCTVYPTISVSQRYEHTAVWTGEEMILWGGCADSECVYLAADIEYLLDSGIRYNPIANIWMYLPTVGVPSKRYDHTAVWTGEEMLIWGGETFLSEGGYEILLPTNTGARYNPVTNTWTVLPTVGAPYGQYGHTAVWTGTEMIVWGGILLSPEWNQELTNSGARYNPVTNTWTALPTQGAPSARNNHTAVWTGNEMVVWGGCTDYSCIELSNDGAQYNPVTNTWTALPTQGAPSARNNHTAVWTGNEMVVWGGAYRDLTCCDDYGNEYYERYYLGDGGMYHIATNSWAALPTQGAPSARSLHTAVWAGEEMIVWGGKNSSYTPFNTGARYNPVTNTWTALPTVGAPYGQYGHTAVWTGTEMIVWGEGIVEAGEGWVTTSTGLGRYVPPQ